MDDLLFIDGNKAYVGVEHGKKANVSPENAKKLADIAKQYGAYYEGVGTDISALNALPKTAYKGSWDDLMQKNVEGYPPEFLYTLFTNVAVNKQDSALTAPNKTIFDAILLAQDKISALKGRNFNADTLKEFLQNASERDVNLLTLANQPATKANVKQFLNTGENLMWSEDNETKKVSNARILAERANAQRQKFLANQPGGVFVVGSDHIRDLRKLTKPETFANPFYKDPFGAPDF
jgi:hypothetical protein